MGLQFGKDKCVKMHIGKYHNPLICLDTEVEAWKDTIVTTDEGKEYFQVIFEGIVSMKNVFDKKLFR